MPLTFRARAMLALALLLAATAAAAAAPAPAHRARSAAPAGNLLGNPGFERGLAGHDWMPTSWDTSDAGLATVFFGRDTSFAHSGHYSVNIANTSMLFPMAHNWSQTLLVGREAWGKVVHLRVWSRSNGVDGRAYVMVQAYSDTVTKMARIWGVDREEARRRMGINAVDDPLLDLGWKRTSFSERASDWVLREASTFVPPGTNVLFVRCGLIGTGQVFFDDASLALEPAPPVTPYAVGQNLFADPSFEDGGDAWDLAIPPFEGARLDVDSTVAHTGRRSVRLSNFHDGLVQSRMGVAQPFLGRALAGRRVRVTAWTKGDSLRSSVFVKIYVHTRGHRVLQSPGAELLAGTWDWKPISIAFDVPKDAELVWAWCIADAPAEGTVWFDDLRFEVLPPDAPPSDAGH